MSNIVGREKEIKELTELYESGKAEFVAVYGRRRVGKTFLVDESLKGKITMRLYLSASTSSGVNGIFLPRRRAPVSVIR